MLCLRLMRTLAQDVRSSQQKMDKLCNDARKRTLTSRTLMRPNILRPHAFLELSYITSQQAITSTTSIAPITPPLDLLPKISTHPALASIQLRNGPRDTFDPSHRVRKRRAGFLARKRTRTGRSILTRRRVKRRNTLSH